MSDVDGQMVEVLGKIASDLPGGRTRLVGCFGGDRYALGELDDFGKFKRITPAVTFEDVARIADGVLAGATSYVTHPNSLKVLALGFAVIRARLLPTPSEPSPSRDGAPAGDVGSSATASAPAGATAAPPATGRLL